MRAVRGVGIVEFVIGPVVAAIFVAFVEECHYVNDGLRMLFLLLFGDAVGLQRPLPFLR